MKSVGTRFLVPFGILAVLGSVFVFYQTYESSREHAYKLISQQAALALQFNLGIRAYARENIVPLMEKLVDKDTFIPETMSTSFISRRIFEQVKKKFPNDILRFSSDNPRNPINRATPDEQRMIEYFRQNPLVGQRTEEIEIEGGRYLAYFSPMVMKRECLRCHGDPKDAPAELIKRYGPTASFYRELGDVVGLDTVAVPVGAITASLAAEMRSRSMILAAVLVLLFGSIFYIFRFMVGRRLASMASHFDKIAAHAESPWMTPVEIKGNDEISVVGIAFNKLVEQLRTTHASLEKRVSERTEELRHANAQLQLELTERKKAEKALQKSEKTLKALLDANPESMLLIDNEFNVIAANNTSAQRFGKLLDEFIGVNLYDIFPSDVLNRRKPYLDQVVQTGEIAHWEDMSDGIQFSTYAYPVLDETGKVSRVAILGVDITERKRAENELSESERRYRELVELSPDAIFIQTEGKIAYINPAGVKLFGATTPKELLGSPVLDLMHPDSKELVAHRIEILRDGITPVPRIEEKYLGLDGTIVNVEVSATPFNYQGKPGALVMVRDITERQKDEEERLRFSKLESMGILAGGIAHDFNNILTTILGNIGLTMLNKNLGEEGMETLEQAEKACFRAQELSGQLLTFAKGGAPIKKLVSLVKLVRESTKLSLAGSNSLCEFSLPENIWSVEIDEGQISQVISNLLINASQAMPNGGVIKIVEENIEVAEGSDLPLSKGKYVKLSISDQGIGIPDKYLDKVFDPYFTTKQKGSGLGLATAYSVIKKHSGYIKVESQLGVGTTFELYLPAKNEELPASLDEPSKPLIGNGKVLVMDDDDKVRETLCRIIRTLGYAADSANDGSQALEKFAKAKESGQPFDAVILDLTVPGGMGGKETIENLLKIDPRVKAIVSSGYSDAPIMANFENYGFNAVIAKPYRVAALSEILQRIIIKQLN